MTIYAGLKGFWTQAEGFEASYKSLIRKSMQFDDKGCIKKNHPQQVGLSTMSLLSISLMTFVSIQTAMDSATGKLDLLYGKLLLRLGWVPPKAIPS